MKLFQTTGPWAFVHVAFTAEKRTGTQQAAAEVGQRSGRQNKAHPQKVPAERTVENYQKRIRLIILLSKL